MVVALRFEPGLPFAPSPMANRSHALTSQLTASTWARGTARPTWSGAARELVIAGAIFCVYWFGRRISIADPAEAIANSLDVTRAEQNLGFFSEQAVQAWALTSSGLISALNHYYVLAHFPATIAFLVWVFVRHNDWYGAVRSWFIGVTLTALIVHIVYPLAPPRMMNGFIDTLAAYGPNIYPDDTTESLANQFAAMPSLHFGWALMVALGAIVIRGSIRSWVALVHPAITLLAIVATGNHYWIDAAIAAALALAFAVPARAWVRRRQLRW
jgi:hypothetical protein